MIGIQYVMDDKGQKVAALIDLKRYGKIWQDIEDGLYVEAHRNSKSMPFAAYAAKRRKRIKKDA